MVVTEDKTSVYNIMQFILKINKNVIFCSSSTQIQSPDEEDFDQFLENVKARSLSVQKQQGEVLSTVRVYMMWNNNTTTLA